MWGLLGNLTNWPRSINIASNDQAFLVDVFWMNLQSLEHTSPHESATNFVVGFYGIYRGCTHPRLLVCNRFAVKNL